MPLTSADIRDKKFHTVRLRAGYNEEDVDELLDRIEATLIALEGGPRTGPLLTADDVLKSRFRTTRLGPGYREDEVDDFLDMVVADLRERGLGGARAAAPPLPPHPSERARREREERPPAPQAVPGPAGVPPHGDGRGPSSRERTGLTPQDIRDQRFPTTRLTTGYDEQEVDDFLDGAEAALEALLGGRPDRAPITSRDVEQVRFATTRARPGYDPARVDHFLDVLAEELRRHERG